MAVTASISSRVKSDLWDRFNCSHAIGVGDAVHEATVTADKSVIIKTNNFLLFFLTLFYFLNDCRGDAQLAAILSLPHASVVNRHNKANYGQHRQRSKGKR